MIFEQLTKNDIKNIFSNTVYHRGLRYFQEGRVRDLYHDPVRNIWAAKVRGSKFYQVTIEEDDGNGISSECNCPAYNQYGGSCKHIAAVCLKIYEHEHTNFSSSNNQKYSDLKRKQEEILKLRQQEAERLKEERQAVYVKQLTNQFIQTITSYSQESMDEGKSKNLLMVDWIIRIQKPYKATQHLLKLEMKVGQKRTYVVKKISDFLRAIDKKAQYPFTKSFTYDPTEQQFTQEDQEIINLLQEAEKYKELYRQFQPSYFQSSGMADEREINIPPMIADDLLKKLSNRPIRFERGEVAFNQITIFHNELPASIQLDKGRTNGFQLDVTDLLAFKYLGLYGYMVQDNIFYKISPEQQLFLEELKKVTDRSNSPILPIATDQIEPFLSQVVPVIEKISKLEMTDKVSSQIVKFPLQAKAYVDLVNNILYVSLEFYYGEHKLDPFKQESQEKGVPIIMRDAEKEQSIMGLIEATSLKFNGKGLYIEGEEGIFEFLYEILPSLEEKVEIFLTNAVKSLVLPDRHAPVTNIEVNSSGNWLEIGFDMAGIEQEEIQNILQSVVEKKKYYRLANGAFVSLKSDKFQTIQNIIQDFNIRPQQLQQKSIKLPIYRGMQLDEMINKENGGKAKYGKQFRRLLNRLKNPEELDFEIPDLLQAELRDYQYYGFQWLKTLELYKLGGILADDMGLGKTLQSIAFILSQFSVNKYAKPTLIVAPASLVYNWKNEFLKFAPSLTVEVMIGSPQERMEKLQSDCLPNVWITSYPTLRQDIDYYNQLQFSTLILDEAQVIKNYTTKTAKAVREIQAETCFALSGTPIENSIDELWSIFQTIMPNFFPHQKAFRQLELEKISMMIRPFLLRRMKRDVLKELPDKIETVNYSELTKPQKELYLAYLERIQGETKESLQKDGYQKSQIKILAGLTRLRQLCCHPSLFLENYKGDSGKLEQLMEIVGNAVENGRRLLIFSQFTSMLSIIREQLTKAGLHFFYLDGQTAPKERIDMVEKFNQGNGEAFLLSLKAGNTGLNLTGADTVILYDLWWNPAVEEQAAGRAHRIGQKNVVQVIRMVTQGTIEEKIYELQQSKKELIDTVVQPGDQAISKITEQEIREILNI
ncbi:SNF2 helicase associated domain-containing protein [Bacillus sp. EB600]|uniref:SNF2 helicase associated domain-containing protein n=1 Tax=Bacillus sp. EB600 TaxID=2806345 RepID=UPI002109E847|nr:SNF2 helicase associated domain-containing protein [Bacillus sp. EB600]MCQ6280497.1 DEAD/DEAH box helicase [Bacillus sp. EB600]